MTDVDEAILAALDEITTTAPPPVPAESIAAVVSDRSTGRRPRRLLVLAAAAVVITGIGATAMISMTSSKSDQPVQIEAADEPADTTTDSTTMSPADTAESQTTSRLVVAEGGWLSEIIPQVADQVPGLGTDQLWAALQAGQPHPPFDTADLSAAEVEGMSAERLRWEGLLLSTDYTFTGEPDPADVLAAMHNEFLQVTEELGYDEAMAEVGYSSHEVVIIASLIEAEATMDADRPKVARVIYNRLAEGMPIGIDSAVFYGAQNRDLALTAELLNTPGPFNLRHPAAVGLPPTPIGAPSAASLEAAINPADGPWLFYVVADEAGTHVFASTLDEHNANVVAAGDKGLLD